MKRGDVFELMGEWLRAVEEGAPGEAGTADDSSDREMTMLL